jgi:hypothetical protein
MKRGRAAALRGLGFPILTQILTKGQEKPQRLTVGRKVQKVRMEV